MSVTECDVCGRQDLEPLELGEVLFAVSRWDHDGYFDAVDICSPTCLATLAVTTANHLGAVDARADMRAAAASNQAQTKRKWWQR